MRTLLDRVDKTLGRLFGRALGALCLVAGLVALISGLLAIRSQGFRWALLMPVAAGLLFIWLGVWLWRVRRRLSEYDWSGV